LSEPWRERRWEVLISRLGEEGWECEERRKVEKQAQEEVRRGEKRQGVLGRRWLV